MEEVGQFLGAGTKSIFFRLKDHPRLGVKIRVLKYRYKSEPISDKEAKKELEKELEYGKLLRKLSVPVPKCIGVIKIKLHEHLVETINKKPDLFLSSDETVRNMISSFQNCEKYGLLMEFIEEDLSLVSEKRVKFVYRKEISNLENMGIQAKDSSDYLNVLWSKKKAKLYFIDFEDWSFPDNDRLQEILKKAA